MAINNQRVVWTKAVQKRCKSLDVLREIRTQWPGEQNRPGCAALQHCSCQGPAADSGRHCIGAWTLQSADSVQTLCSLAQAHSVKVTMS